MYGDNDVTGIVHENVEITTEHADWYDPQKFARMEKEAWRGWYKATGREKTIQERGSDDDRKVGGIQQNMRVGRMRYSAAGTATVTAATAVGCSWSLGFGGGAGGRGSGGMMGSTVGFAKSFLFGILHRVHSHTQSSISFKYRHGALSMYVV